MQITKTRGAVLAAVALGLTIAACVDTPAPTGADAVAATVLTADPGDHSGAHGDMGYIGGWLDGEVVQLRYTRVFFCEEPPVSGAPSDCVVGAPGEVTPRMGPIQPIYAIAAAGIQPPVATMHCPGGTTCLNHPSTLDLSRIGGPPSALAGPHSHIIAAQGAGWHQTVNIRVSNLAVWNDIAAAKSLARVRELQADPEIGGKGLISQDTPTNIFFFFQVHKP